jgi:hypothetical protein
MNKGISLIVTAAAFGLVYLAGCIGSAPEKSTKGNDPKKTEVSATRDKSAKIEAALAKLDPADRKLAEAQEWCVISNGPRGNMGAPLKLTIDGQPVFVCCDHCTEAAEADHNKTLAKAEELKAKHAKAAVK